MSALMEKLNKAEEANKKAEEVNKKAEKVKTKVEEEMKKAEEAKKKAEEAMKKAEEKANKLQRQLEQTIATLVRAYNYIVSLARPFTRPFRWKGLVTSNTAPLVRYVISEPQICQFLEATKRLNNHKDGTRASNNFSRSWLGFVIF